MELTSEMQSQAKALADPSRFRIFEYICAAAGPTFVGELTDLMQFNHNAIRQHLSVLVDAGLVAESHEQRSTPGRPRKQYHSRADALAAFGSVSGSYERLAELLLELATSGTSPYDVGFNAAGSDATFAPEPVPALVHQLTLDGFAPTVNHDGVIELGNCPFAAIAAKNPGVVCELHHGLIDGRLTVHAGVDGSKLAPRDPNRAGCLVTVQIKTER